MLNCYTTQRTATIPIVVIKRADFARWLAKTDAVSRVWLTTTHDQPPAITLIPDKTGALSQVLLLLEQKDHAFAAGALPLLLPAGVYTFDTTEDLEGLTLAWGLGAYQFTHYKTATKTPAQLRPASTLDIKMIDHLVSSIYWVRDLINIPTEDLGPSEFAEAAQKMAREEKAHFKQWIGNALLKENFPIIHAVGRASNDAPRLLELHFGNPKHPPVTLVGKGVCFDSGGLNIKNAGGMALMKKDMGGAAHVLGLARMIARAQLPIYLQVLVPLVENVISGDAFRPGDVLKSRKGLTVEIGNTDAEGRLILADALAYAAESHPDLIIDIATLTGAARVAVGTEISAFFTDDEALASELYTHAAATVDPIWRLPLFTPYREMLQSAIADLNNAPNDGYAGAITAALFLKEFVPADIPWIHFDLMAWNVKSRPGRPAGGEAMALRALFSLLKKRYPRKGKRKG